MKRVIVWTMVVGRAVMGPVVALLAWQQVAGWLLAMIVFAMLIDDIADGIVARSWGLDTPRLRSADSAADTVFYLGTSGAVWLRAPQTLRDHAWMIAVLFFTEAIRYIFDFIKYGKAASYHSYLAKTWGVILAATTITILILQRPDWSISVTAGFGILVNLEGLFMSLMLPEWHNDVKTLSAAMRIRASATHSSSAAR